MNTVLTELPVGWSMVALGRLVRFGNGSDYKDVEVSDGGYPVYGSGGVFRRSSEYLYDGESVLFGRKGTIDRPLYVTGRFWTVDTMYYTIPGPRILPKFLYYVAATIPFSYYATNTAVPSMTQGDLASHRIPLPPLDEQRAIADYLDQETAQIDALVAKQEELIRRLEERRLAVVTTTALTGLQDEKGGGHDTSRWGSSLAVEPWLNRAPASWRMERFKTVCLPREERNIAGTELMLSLTIRGQLVDRSTMAIQQNASDASIPRYFVTRPGDLVVNPMWLIGGAIGVSDKRGAVSPDYRVFEIAEGLDPWYLHAVLRSVPYFDQYRLYTRSNTTFDRRIKQNDLDNLPLPIPPLDEQRDIVKHIRQQTTQIDALIAKAEEHITLAKERRAALITAAVSGQIAVRTAVAARKAS